MNARAGVTISSSTTNPTAGAPVTFAVSVATSANVNNVRVDFGDGSGQDLGPLTGSTNVAHNYSAPGSYRPTATAFPAGGDPESVSTTVNVGAMSVTVTGPGSTGVGTAATFTATPSSGTQVDHFTWTYDDGTVHTTTTWLNPGTPFDVDSDIDVSDDITMPYTDLTSIDLARMPVDRR